MQSNSVLHESSSRRNDLHMNLYARSLSLCLFALTSCVAIAADDSAKIKGFSTTQPEKGPFVAVEGGFMIPYTETIPGTEISFEMIPVPAGSYKMGSPASEKGHKEDESPQIMVNVDPMWVCKTEVRWLEYKEFMGMYKTFKEFVFRDMRKVTPENKVDAVTTPTELYEPSYTFEFGDDDDLPAVTMTQFAAKQFTKWLSKMTDTQYRIPTEAEWEWAARAGSTTAYSWGESADEIDQYAWYADNSPDGPSKVGLKKPNAFGLNDMLGNVAEWTIDAYLEDGYKVFEGKTVKASEAIKSIETADPRVVRGGSWEMEPEDVRCASRLYSVDEDWKMDDPNIPLSPWWFTSDPSRGVGMRLFRSWKPLSDEAMNKFWEIDSEDIEFDVMSRIEEGRGVLGLADPDLAEAAKAVRE